MDITLVHFNAATDILKEHKCLTILDRISRLALCITIRPAGRIRDTSR
jgi:hypothetical protein